MTLEDDLRAALHEHAERIEPSPDGLERIESRLTPTTKQRPRLAPRLLAAAAAVAVLAGVAAFALIGTDSGDVDVAAPTTSLPTDPAAIEDELPPLDLDGDTDAAATSGGSVSDGTPALTVLPAAPPGVLGPKRATVDEAVASFLDLIQKGNEEVAIDLDGDLATVTRMSEAGVEVEVTRLQLGSTPLDDGSTGAVVIQALSPRIVIESPSSLSTTSGSMLAVSGRGEGFEATIGVDLYSSQDGVWLNKGSTRGGNFGELAPFATDLEVWTSGPAWLVVSSSGGEDTKLEPFAAVPIVLDAPLPDTAYTVVDIPDDDPDGGLVVRNLPGTDGAQLDVLPAGQSDIHRRSLLSAFVGDGEPIYGFEPVQQGQQEWWNIRLPEPLPDGRQWGWVNARYLAEPAPEEPPPANDDVALLELGWQFVEGLRGDDTALAALPWDGDGVTFGLASDLSETTADKAANPAFWAETFTFELPPAYDGTTSGTLREILSPTRTQLGAETAVGVEVVSVDNASVYQLVNDTLAAQIPEATCVIRILDPTNDGSGWRIIALYVSDGPDGPVVSGMAGIDWTP